MIVAPLTGKAQASAALASARVNVWEGSVRSSKTVSSLLAWLRFVRTGPPGNLLMAGKTERTLKRNIIDPLVEWLGKDKCRHVEGSGEVWLFGRRIYTAGANDERSQEKIRGLTLAGAYCDEISTMPESFWSMLLTRLSVDGARLLGTSNPDSPAHWLMRDYLSRAALWLDHHGNVLRTAGDDRLDLARFSFRLADNPHLSTAYVESLSREFVGLWRKRFIEGLWVAAEGAIYDMWDENLHVVDIVPPIQRWLCASVDYGTANPFHALLIGLGVDGVIYVTSEWRYDSRAAHRQLTDAEYSERFRSWLDTAPVPASRRPDGSWLRGIRPEHVIVDPSAASFRTQLSRDGLPSVTANNEVLDGIRAVSSLLAAGKMKLSRDCPALAAEIPGYAWDDRAAKLGEDKPVKINDHGCLVAGTPVLTAAGWWPIEAVSIGDLVMTRCGLKPVLAAGMTNPAASTVRVEMSNGQVLEGTWNHPVWIEGHGFRSADSLRYGDRLHTWQKPRSSPTRASGSGDTRTRPTGRSGLTTRLASRIASEASAGSMKRSGLTRTARYLMAAMSITMTTTRSTTTRRTWPALTEPVTSSITPARRTTGPRNGWLTWLRSGRSRWNGTVATRAGRGTVSTGGSPGRDAGLGRAPASSAAILTRRSRHTAGTGSAQTPASRPGGALLASTMLTAHATCAAARSASTSTRSSSTAPVLVLRVAAGHQSVPVYNLTVADCPEYFAAGVLVHNCDSLRYGVFSTRALWGHVIQLAQNAWAAAGV